MTVRELKETLSHLDENDVVVAELHDIDLSEGLYDFYVDSLIKMDDGRREVRISLIKSKDDFVRTCTGH